MLGKNKKGIMVLEGLIEVKSGKSAKSGNSNSIGYCLLHIYYVPELRLNGLCTKMY